MRAGKKALLLHSQGLPVGQIAEKLKADPEDVRGVIARHWAAEKEEELLRIRVAGRRG